MGRIIDRLRKVLGLETGPFRIATPIGEALATETTRHRAMETATRMANASGELVVVHDVRTGRGTDVRPEGM